MRPGAVFDLDGTLVLGTSAERLLVPFLWQRGLLGWPQISAALALAATLPLRGRTHALRRNKRYLRGLSVDAVANCLPLFMESVLARRWNQPLLARAQELRSQGYALHLVTGAPDFMAAAVAHHLGFDAHAGTRLEQKRGQYTGGLAGPHIFAEQKVETARGMARLHGLDLSRSVGFADHATDAAFLSCFGQAVAVEPDRGLRREAQRRGWAVAPCPTP